MKNNKILIDDGSFLCFLRYATIFLAFVFFMFYIFIVVSRIHYRFELEWIEGGMLNQVWRIENGQSVYIAPSIDFVPFLYPPLYFYLSAIASRLLGGGFFPLRFLSFVASLVSFTMILLIVYAETRNWWAGILSVGLFVATFRLTGAWLDIAREDSLFIALWLLFVFLVIHKNSLWYAMLSGVTCSLAFLTKQTIIILCLPVMAYLLWSNRKYAFWLLATTFSIIGLTTLILHKASSGWYTYYVFGLLSQQTEWLPLSFMITFWINDLLIHLPVASLFIIYVFIEKPSHAQFNFYQWITIFVGAIVGSFLLRVKIGGYDNVLLPVYAIGSILFGLGVDKVITEVKIYHRVNAEKVVLIAILIQFAILLYNPWTQVPSDFDEKAGNEFVQFISNYEKVYLPDHGYLSFLAGKESFAHHSAIWDIMRTDHQSMGKSVLTESLNKAIRQQRFDMIIFDSEWNWCCSEIDDYYILLDQKVFLEESVFYPVTGWRRRPTLIYLAKRLQPEIP